MTIESQIAELKRQIEVMQAYERGEEVEKTYRFRSEQLWQSIPGRVWFDWNDYDYRVKPKRREVWAAFDKNGMAVTYCNAPIRQQGCEVIRFVEAD